MIISGLLIFAYTFSVCSIFLQSSDGEMVKQIFFGAQFDDAMSYIHIYTVREPNINLLCVNPFFISL